MKIKKKWFVIIPVIVAILVFFGLLYYFNREDANSFTVSDNNWIKEHTDTLVDFEVISNYPVFGENNGVFFEFIDKFEESTGLDFNIIPYLKTSESGKNSYRFRALANSESLTEQDLLLHEDVYVAISKIQVNYSSITQFKNLKIGVFSNDSGEVSYYLKSASNITYKPYTDSDDMFNDLDEGKIDMVVIPNLMYLDKTVGKNDYYINYIFSELSKKIVLTLADDDKEMNRIVSKYYQHWKDNYFVEEYNEKLLDYYIAGYNINDKTKTDFLSNVYVYGYVENYPYEVYEKDGLYGIAASYINRMLRLGNVDFIEYKKYDSIEELKKAIDEEKVDIYFNYFDYSTNKYKATISPFIEKYVVLARLKDGYTINSFEALKGHQIAMLKDNAIYNYFKDNSKAIIKEYDNLDKLLNSNNASVIVLDKEVYSYYRNSKFDDYEVLYEDTVTNSYNFMIKNADDNDTFYKLFNYIIKTNSYYSYRNDGLNSLDVSFFSHFSFEELFTMLFLALLIPVVGLIIVYWIFTRRKQVKKVKKEERRKYTDMLTSLKNRNYLNFSINTWNRSKIFPKAVIVIDLNNVKYVNDNYGHESGDKLIVGAASILVNTQLENSEIIRTDGNEFLIYLMGYSEQQVTTYSKKLVKEFKTLPYGFGAALGFSMIVDEIKTIDDAINEATLEMRKDKEENK